MALENENMQIVLHKWSVSRGGSRISGQGVQIYKRGYDLSILPDYLVLLRDFLKFSMK